MGLVSSRHSAVRMSTDPFKEFRNFNANTSTPAKVTLCLGEAMFKWWQTLALVPALLAHGPFLHPQAPAIAPALLAQMDLNLSEHYPPDGPGVAVLLAQEGRVVFQKSYGLANLQTHEPLAPDAMFPIGSVTKQFTAAAVLKLVEDGKVDLQAPVSAYLEHLPEAWRTVTVEQVLTHTSGLPEYVRPVSQCSYMDESFTPQALLEKTVIRQPLGFQPGTRYHYCNTGYFLLGMLIEKLSGRTYAEFLQERLLTPLGLGHTRYDSDSAPRTGMPSGYLRGPKAAPSWSVTQRYSAGGLVSCTEDLALWTQALHDGKVVGPESLARMLRPVRLPDGGTSQYGYGLAFRQSHGHRQVWHNGQVPGFTAYVSADPKAKAVVVILGNRDDIDSAYHDDAAFAHAFLALAEGLPIPEHIPDQASLAQVNEQREGRH